MKREIDSGFLTEERPTGKEKSAGQSMPDSDDRVRRCVCKL